MPQLVPLLTSVTAALLLTRLVRSLAERWNIVDEPDGQRKLQARAVPLWGGVGTFAALVLGALAARAVVANLVEFDRLASATLMSATLVFLIGLVDDYRDLSGRIKLLLQIVAVLPIVLAGFYVQKITILNHDFDLGMLAVPLTIVWYVGCTNALNLLDGMDGSATTVGLVGSLALAAIGYYQGHEHVALLALSLAGGLAGFFCYNRPPASIYLGDCGSTVIGLVLAVLCIEGAAVHGGAVRVALPLVVMTIPILDTSLAIVRRRLSGRPFDVGDRGHIHHRFLERGLSTWQALGLMATVSLCTGLASIVAVWINSEPLAWLAAMFVIVALAQLRYFGNYELRLAKLLATDRLRRLLAAVRQGQVATQPDVAWNGQMQQDFEKAWHSLTNELAEWRSARVELQVRKERQPVGARRWFKDPAPETGSHQWRMGLTFKPSPDVEYDVVVSGHDPWSAEPWYLSQVAGTLKRFAQTWSELPAEQRPNLQLFTPDADANPDWRDAA